MTIKKNITEDQILTWLEQEEWAVPPLTVDKVQILGGAKDRWVDAILTLSWGRKKFRFGAEVKSRWTPKVIAAAADEISKHAAARKLIPLVVVPYLEAKRLEELAARGVSGLDLCGNAVLAVPGELLVFRTGSPNRFRWEGGIKNVYRGTSGIVARLFLLKPEFPSVGDALEEIEARGGKVALATVSKVCNSLQQDLVIERTAGKTPTSRKLRLLQPEKLVDLLRDNYLSPEITRAITGKCTKSADELVERLLAWEEGGKGKVVLTGAGSVDAYAVMAREPLQTFYCSDVAGLQKSLGEDFRETERFATVKFLQTREDFVYFDRRPQLVASPLQTYLELATGEKREKETAEQVRRFILSQSTDTKRRR